MYSFFPPSSHFYISRRDAWCHITSSLQVKMTHYVWTGEETEYAYIYLFLQVIKEKKYNNNSYSKET